MMNKLIILAVKSIVGVLGIVLLGMLVTNTVENYQLKVENRKLMSRNSLLEAEARGKTACHAPEDKIARYTKDAILKIYAEYKDQIDALWVAMPDETTLAQATVTWIESVIIDPSDMIPILQKEESDATVTDDVSGGVPDSVPPDPCDSEIAGSVVEAQKELTVVEKFIQEVGSPGLIYVWQDACPPCQWVKHFPDQFKANYKVRELDANDIVNEELLDELGVEGTPSFLAIYGNDFVRDETGDPAIVDGLRRIGVRRDGTAIFTPDRGEILKLFGVEEDADKPPLSRAVGRQIDELLKIARTCVSVVYVRPSTWQGYYSHNVDDHGYDANDLRSLSLSDQQALHSAVHDRTCFDRMKSIRRELKCPGCF